MKLKDIGKYKDYVNVFSNLTDINNQTLYKFTDKLNKLDSIEEAGKVLKLSNVPKNAGEKILNRSKFKNNTNEIQEILSSLSTADELATTTAQKVGYTFSGIGQSIASFASTTVGQIAIVTTALAGIGMLANYLDGPSYDELLQQSAASTADYASAQKEADSVKQNLSNIDSRILEINSHPLALVDQKELSALQAQRKELEQTAALKDNLAKSKRDKAALDAGLSMNAKSDSKALNASIGGFAKWFIESPIIKSDNPIMSGLRALNPSLSMQKASLEITDQQAVTADIAALNNLKEARQKLESTISKQDNAPSKSQQKDLDNYTKNIAELESDLSKKQGNIASFLTSMTDENGNALKNYEVQVMSLKDSINEIAHYDTSNMTKKEKQFNSIDEFFGKSSSGGMKEHFTELAEAGKLNVDTLKSLGLSKENFDGAGLKTVVQYFNDIAASAKKAAGAVKEADGSIEGIDAASKSQNAGDDFVKMKGYLDQSQKLFKQGLTGTDDFKTIEKSITQGTGKSYQQAYDELQKYFTTDQNKDSEFFGELTRDGIQNFADDFQNLGNTFKTTGEAAKAMGISTQMFEALMGRTEDYDGFENLEKSFQDMASSTKQLSEAKSNLDGLKTIYDSMKDGKQKEKLGLDIENWQAQINSAESDLSDLPEEVVTQLKFEYDKQQLIDMNNESRALVENGMSTEDTLGTQAGMILNNDKITDDILGEKGVSMEDLESNDAFEERLQEIEKLREKLKESRSDADKTNAQSNVLQAQDELNEMLENWDGTTATVKVEADTTDVDELLETLSEDQKEIFLTYFADDESAEEAVEKINELSVDPKFCTLDVDDQFSTAFYAIQAEKLGSKICELSPDDQVTAITDAVNALSLNPKWATLSAEDRASAIVEYFNSLQVDGKSAVITAEGGDQTVSKAKLANDAIQKIASSHNTSLAVYGSETAITNANSLSAAINSIPAFRTSVVSVTTLNNTLPLAPPLAPKGKGGADGTAHAAGSWGLKSSGKALINELGSEIIVRNGSWFVLNNGYPALADLRKGDIIFNHKQSKEIFHNGYVTGSHAQLIGSAHNTGTAHADGTVSKSIMGRAFSDGSDNNFKETFDHIEIWIKRMESALDKLTDSIDTYSYNLTKQNSAADSAMTSIKGNIATLEKAYQTYMDKANSVGLETDWMNVVKNGEIKISEITDKDLKERIDDYKEYYDNALNMQKKISELQKELLDLAVQKLENIDNYFSNRFDYNKDFGFETSIPELKEVLNKYTDELNAQVDSGVIKEDSDEWYKAQGQIADYMQDILKATWDRYQVIIDNLDRIGDNLEDSVSLKKARGQTVTEEDYQKEIDNNNRLIREYYKTRQDKLSEQNKYDVNSDLYKDLEKDISGLDSKIYSTLKDNEKLKESIWDVRFGNPFEKVTDGLDDTIASTKNLRSLLDDDTFLDKNGSLTANGLANLALLNQSMAASRQKAAEYTAGLKKLDEAYHSGIISLEDYEKSQGNFLKEIQNSIGDVEDYKKEIIDMYKDQLKAETEAQKDYYDKRKDSLALDKEYYEFSKKVDSQSKNINQLKAQIAALQGVNNDSARSELRRLQEELASKEEDLADTKRDHAYDMQKQGYDTLSDDLDTALKDTLTEITTNADKQEQVVSEMLSHVVANYQDAYNVIQNIISGTGFIGNEGFQSNISNLNSQQGAKDQVNAGTAEQSQVKPSDTVSNVNTGSINQNQTNDNILNDIQNIPDINNRKVAEIRLSTTALTLTQGKTAKVSASVRPTDAKNKTLKWDSSNPAAATVSGGSICAKEPGTANITCMATDGSGQYATVSVSVTPKPAPAPAPPPSQQNTSPHGGIPFHEKQDFYPKHLLNLNTSITDRLKYYNFDSSMDATRELYSYWGGSGFYSGTYSQNVWLINKMKSAGYKSGTRSVSKSEPDFIHKGEIIIRKNDGGMLMPLNRGDAVIPSGLTDNLWKLAEHAPSILSGTNLNLKASTPVYFGTAINNTAAEVHIENLLNIEGDVASDDIIGKIKAALPYCAKELAQQVSKEFTRDADKIK